MRRLGGHVVADQLVAQGVDTVFGVPGESFLTVLDGLWEHRDTIRFVTARHEATASHMARHRPRSGYTRRFRIRRR